MHQTVVPENDSLTGDPCPVTALVPVGLPGAGCTTVAELAADIGIPVINQMGVATPAQPLAKATYEPPHVVCVDNVTTQDGLEWVEDMDAVEDTLVVRVRVGDDAERRRRLAEHLLETMRSGGIRHENMIEAQEYIDHRESLEVDPPDHHLTLYNGSDVETTDIIVRLDELTSILAPNCGCEGEA